MTHKLKTETFSHNIEHSGSVIVLPLTPLFSFVTFHLNRERLLYNFKSFPLVIFLSMMVKNLFMSTLSILFKILYTSITTIFK